MFDDAINANDGCSADDEMEADTKKEPTPPDTLHTVVTVGPRSAPK